MRAVSLCSTLLLLLLLLLVVTPRACDGGNVLVVPAEGSHWVNMDVLLRALRSRGHDITVMRTTKSWYVRENAAYYQTVTVPVERSLDQSFITDMISEFLQFERGALPLTSFLHATLGLTRKMIDVHEAIGELVPATLNDRDLTRTLKETKYDLVLTDPCWGSGVILAKYLDLPLVYNVRWLLSGDAHNEIAPSPLSYVPMTGSGHSDAMTFVQRVKNTILYFATKFHFHLIARQVYQKICDKYLGPGQDFHQLMLDADIWLMRADFVFDFPRPTMPNVVYVGGFQCKPAQPLPERLEEFVQSSGEHGLIIMSMGTFVSQLPAEITDEIAAAFAKLPQKVIWRYKGAKPSTLGNNTLLVDWMPQNDLLGHPKTKLFVAHGGTNGVQEAIYHGVPVVGLPLFFDQYDNLLRLKERGGAEILDFKTVDKDDNFVTAVQRVLNDPSYRASMQRLSRLHRDQPMTPLNTALYWIEFVMRHKGAAHLRTESYKLPWYSYHSVDVVLFLTGTVLLIILTTVALIRCLFTKMCQRKIKHD